MAKKMFKSESKRLLDLMINSIYTHKEIFLRELISNASDATDKLYFISLKDENIDFEREKFYIRIELDKEKRTITIKDNGIGMTKEELEDNLGTIAKSGSYAFKNENEKEENVDIIGQFGVGFYSAFMVAKEVVVTSKKFGSDEAFMWKSEGADGYEIVSANKDEAGTEIVLKLKDNSEDENYDEFLESYRIKGIVKKYSDYIKYPIKMECSQSRKKEGSEDEYETVIEDETLNSMVPIWRKNKSEVTDEEYNEFYKDKFHDFTDPAKVIYTSADGVVSYRALLYIPKKVPFDYYSKDYEKGLQLYTNGVLIMDKCKDLVPDCFSFVKGLVDSQDLSLNISREILQHDRQLKVIANHLKKKIKNELKNFLTSDREKYEEFYNAFSRQLKFGIYDNFGMEKDLLSDLVMFYSYKNKKLITLDEYIGAMPEEQKFIYYACAENTDKADKLPQTEIVKDKGYDILYLTEDVDEFAVKIMGTYNEKEFKSVSDGDVGIESEENKNNQDNEVLKFMKEALKDKVQDVIASKKLKNSPTCISTRGEITLEMEKVLNAVPNENKVKANKILEINMDHNVYKKAEKYYNEDKEKLKKYANVLYNGALLIEGLSVEDPIAFSNDICDLI